LSAAVSALENEDEGVKKGRCQVREATEQTTQYFKLKIATADLSSIAM
jgi:hypothetical protein